MNHPEILMAIKLLVGIGTALPNDRVTEKPTAFVITPYKKQCELIEKEPKTFKYLWDYCLRSRC